MTGESPSPEAILGLYQTASAAGNNLWIFHITVCVFIVGLIAERGGKIGWQGRALLTFAFACFAVGTFLPIINAHLLSVDLAKLHNQNPLGQINLRTFPNGYIIALHSLADAFVVAIVQFWRRPGRPTTT